MINKKIVLGALLVSTLTLQIGCASIDKPSSATGDNTNLEQTDTKDSTNNEAEQEAIMDEFNSIIKEGAKLSEIIGFIDENISLVSEDNVSNMICKLEEIQEKKLSDLGEKFYSDSNIQEKMAKAYTSDFDINSIDNIDDKKLKDLLKETRDSGYKVETAEGTFFPIINYEFYKKYSSYVTPDISEYIDIMSVESNQVPLKDAALVIDWDEVFKRALRQEEFINEYNESVKIGDIVRLYKNYVTSAIYGANNTPVFDYESKLMVSKAKDAYLNVAENNGDSILEKSIIDYLDILKKNNYKLTDDVVSYRKYILENINEKLVDIVPSLD